MKHYRSPRPWLYALSGILFIGLLFFQRPVRAEGVAIKPGISITAAHNRYGFEPILHVDFPGPYVVGTKGLNTNHEILYICYGPTDLKLFAPGDFTFVTVYTPGKNHESTKILSGIMRNHGNKTVTFTQR